MLTQFSKTMARHENKYICINCGAEVKSLFKKYSETVLKLIECETCNNIADKYIEYSLGIVIIDLILLQKAAYRHILFNAEFKNFWKLAVILLLMEAYSEWVRHCHYLKNDTAESLLTNFIELGVDDFQFYKICLDLALKTAWFLTILYVLTGIYCRYQKTKSVDFMMTFKAMTISNFGMFLFLPSLIWDNSLQEFHLSVVVLYTTLCQLLAYSVLCHCPKIWAIIAIFTSYYCKAFLFDMLEFASTAIKNSYLMI